MPSRKQPLFIITGASCVGKSAMCEVLFRKETDYIVMESDLLWEKRYDTPKDDYCAYRRLWMRVCAQISQIGKPVVLCGCAVPAQFETRPERTLFSGIHYLALVSGEAALIRRAKEGRGVADKRQLKSSVDFNGWLKENAKNTEPAMTLLDTTAITPEEAAVLADGWIRQRLKK